MSTNLIVRYVTGLSLRYITAPLLDYLSKDKLTLDVNLSVDTDLLPDLQGKNEQGNTNWCFFDLIVAKYNNSPKRTKIYIKRTFNRELIAV